MTVHKHDGYWRLFSDTSEGGRLYFRQSSNHAHCWYWSKYCAHHFDTEAEARAVAMYLVMLGDKGNNLNGWIYLQV